MACMEGCDYMVETISISIGSIVLFSLIFSLVFSIIFGFVFTGFMTVAIKTALNAVLFENLLNLPGFVPDDEDVDDDEDE